MRSADTWDTNISAMRARLWSKGAYTRVMTSRNKNSSMKSICPERIRLAPARMVVATPRRMMTLAALTKMPVPSSPWMVTFSWSSIFWLSPAR